MSEKILHVPPEAIVETQLDERIEEIEKELSADAMTYSGQISYGSDDIIRDAVEGISNKRPNLAVILETPGGYIEVVQRIVDTLRHHYDQVDFIVPNVAMSAGTVLAMSGDSIYMDYYSVLGPIDPQVPEPDTGNLVPALGYLTQYERLIKKSAEGSLTTAEMAILLKKYDPAQLYRYEQARELSISLLKEWLVKYKFKDWKKTESRGKKVTKRMKISRAAAIARALNDTAKWHSHGRGISMEILRTDLNLRIEDFGARKDLDARIKSYYRLLQSYMMRMRNRGVLHRRGRYEPITFA